MKFVAILPVLWLLISLIVLKMNTWKAGASALVLTAIAAVFVFNMRVEYLLEASIEGMMMALFPIIWVVVSALFVYRVTVESGAMVTIKQMLSKISDDRRIQGLILAFAFGGFLEAVAGFGTAVAIPIGIMVSMGFNPVTACTVCLIGNTIPVAFGVLGVPVITLAQVTSLPIDTLSLYTSLQLLPLVVLLPLVLVYVITGKLKHLTGIVALSLGAGIVFAIGQTLTAIYVGPELPAVVGSLAAMAFILGWVKLFPQKKAWRFQDDQPIENHSDDSIPFSKGLKVCAPYILILVLIYLTRFVPFLEFLNKAPFTIQQQFFFGPGGKAMTFQLATSGGTILFISAIIGGLIQGLTLKKIMTLLKNTITQTGKTIVTIICIVALSKVMGYSGMVREIAEVFALAGSFFPFVSPMVGALGTFITGSDTSSNVLFGNLQKQTAESIGLNAEWLSAANASGATAGKMLSPQSISIASTAAALGGSEHIILASVVKYCVVYLLLLGVLIAALPRLFM